MRTEARERGIVIPETREESDELYGIDESDETVNVGEEMGEKSAVPQKPKKELPPVIPTPTIDKDSGNKNKKKFYDPDVINYDLFAKRVPLLKNVRGSKKKLQSYVFSEIDTIFQSIFEKNKNIFATKGHVIQHLLYAAARMGEQVYLVRKNFPRDELSIILEEQEPMHKFLDNVDTVLENVKFLFEKKCQGILSEISFNRQVKKYLETFKTEKAKKMVSDSILDMLENDEALRVKDRVRKRKQRMGDEEKVANIKDFME